MKIYLPRYFGADEPARRPPDRGALPTSDGSESILVVEDEERVRRYSTDALRELGYRVLEADGAEAALRDHRGRARHRSAVHRRGDAGHERPPAGRRGARAPARLKVLFTTGYTRNAIVHNGMLDPGVVLLSKPFTLEDLARKMAELTGQLGLRRRPLG